MHAHNTQRSKYIVACSRKLHTILNRCKKKIDGKHTSNDEECIRNLGMPEQAPNLYKLNRIHMAFIVAPPSPSCISTYCQQSPCSLHTRFKPHQHCHHFILASLTVAHAITHLRVIIILSICTTTNHNTHSMSSHVCVP